METKTDFLRDRLSFDFISRLGQTLISCSDPLDSKLYVLNEQSTLEVTDNEFDVTMATFNIYLNSPIPQFNSFYDMVWIPFLLESETEINLFRVLAFRIPTANLSIIYYSDPDRPLVYYVLPTLTLLDYDYMPWNTFIFFQTRDRYDPCYVQYGCYENTEGEMVTIFSIASFPHRQMARN